MAQPTHHRQISEASIQASHLVNQSNCGFCKSFISGKAYRVSHQKQGEGSNLSYCVNKVDEVCANYYKTLTSDDQCAFCGQWVKLGQYNVTQMDRVEVTINDASEPDTSALMKQDSQRTASSSNVQTQRESDNRIIGYCSIAIVVIIVIAVVGILIYNRDNSF